jgi:predicted transcriptional regulator YdeE/ketosteroid isomerase-like protein
MGTLTPITPGAESGATFEAIWKEFEACRSQVEPHSTDKKYYGVSFAAGREGCFDYLAGMAVSRVQKPPAGLVVREVPAATYAVFASPVEAIGETKRYIFGEWRSESLGPIDSSAPAFEQYPPAADTESFVLIHIPMRTATEVNQARFNPPPLADDWSKWIVGEWEGVGESQAGQGRAVEWIELGLNGQFLICRGEAQVIEITPQHATYLKKNMHASDEEIERFKREGYQSLQLFSLDQTTGEVVGYLFDSLRCIAAGRGKREGNSEVMQWQWATGQKSTRITERLGHDRMRITQRTPMADGSVMEEKGESVRRARESAAAGDTPEVAAVKAFITAINHRDFVALSALMTDDHTFVDSRGTTVSGRERMLEGWRHYFSMFADYRINVGSVVQNGAVVAVFGWWSGSDAGRRGPVSESFMSGPAAWRGVVEGGRIALWQVYADHAKTSDAVKRSEE